MIASAIDAQLFRFLIALLTLLVLLICRSVTRSRPVATAVAIIIVASVWVAMFQMPAAGNVVIGIKQALMIVALVRFGLLAFVVMELSLVYSVWAPITMHAEAFYFDNGIIAIVFYVALAAYGAYFATSASAKTFVSGPS
jgi:hypothetical protein